MSTSAPEMIARSNLSLAWADALVAAHDCARRALRPLLITVGDFEATLPPEDAAFRRAVDASLAAAGKNPVDVSAMMIFPYKPWVRRGMPDCATFSSFCLTRLLPRLRARDRRNQNGTYFGRMMEATGTRGRVGRTVRQLEFVVGLLRKGKRRPRQSALQLAVFDPAKDHTGQPVRGFPCLQQVSLTYDDDGGLAVNAYYPTQYIFDRAYGNYLGLCHLGHFVAREAGLRFARMTCFVGRPELGEVRKGHLVELVAAARQLRGEAAGEVTPEREGARSPFANTRPRLVAPTTRARRTSKVS